MSLSACLAGHGLSQHVRRGLQAMGKHSKCVQVQHGKVTASADLDTALAQRLPNEPRWDYGLEIAAGNGTRLVWIEVHPAISSEVEAVCRKLRWLRQFLKQSQACQTLPHAFHWVATDSGVHIDATRRRRLAAVGLKMPTQCVSV